MVAAAAGPWCSRRMVAILLRALALISTIAARHPGLDPSRAAAHAIAAASASDPAVPAELLLAIAEVESDLDPTWVSRLEDGVRVTARWRSRSPAGLGPRFCGPLQTQAKWSWSACVAQRNLVLGYRLGAEEIRSWLAATHGDLAAALRGHGCGWSGVRGVCRGYDRRVIKRAREMGMRRPIGREARS